MLVKNFCAYVKDGMYAALCDVRTKQDCIHTLKYIACIYRQHWLLLDECVLQRVFMFNSLRALE